MTRLFSAAMVCAALAPALLSQSPGDLLLDVRHKVMATVNELPRYMCVETIDRFRYESDVRRHLSECDEPSHTGRELKLVVSDRLRLDVAADPVREMYSWAGAGRFDDRTLLDIVKDGAISTGEFGAFLSVIFGGDAATFTYNGHRTDEHARDVAEFGFSVPAERSQNEFGGRNGRRVVVGYDGTLLVDAKTGDLLRLTIRTERLPLETGACDARTMLNYGRVRMRSGDFLLPVEAQLRIAMRNGDESRNRIQYSGCHEFTADSNVEFGDAPSGSNSIKAAELTARPSFELPPELEFRLRLARDLDTAIAAAGDPVEFQVAADVRRDGNLLMAAGTLVRARLVRVEERHGKSASVRVAVRLESIEVGGKQQPFRARREPTSRTFNLGAASFTRQRITLGSIDSLRDDDVEEFYAAGVKEGHVFRAGAEMKWRSAAPSTGDSAH